MKDIKLLVIDLDNTLLKDDKTVSLEDIEALRELQGKNIDIVIASGRFEDSHKQLTKDLNLGLEDSVHIAEGGGVIYQGDRKKIIGYFEPQIYQNILKKVKQKGLQVYVTDGEYVYFDTEGPLDEIYQPDKTTNQKLIKKVEDLSEIKKALKFIFYCDNEDQFNEIKSLVEPGTKAFMAAKVIAEITSENLDKWYALEEIMKEKKLKPENIAAIGDSGNDLLMIQNAGLGLTVKNALPEVIEAADRVSDQDNNNSGVSELIYKYILESGEDNA